MDIATKSVKELQELASMIGTELDRRETEENARLFKEWQKINKAAWIEKLTALDIDASVVDNLELHLHWNRPSIRFADGGGFHNHLVYFETQSEVCLGMTNSPVSSGNVNAVVELFAIAGIRIDADAVVETFCPVQWRPKRVYY